MNWKRSPSLRWRSRRGVNAVMLLEARKKGLDFALHCEFPVPARISTDPTRLTQILLNLCGNAIKFTAHGYVRVGIGYAAERREIRFTVEDSGIGLSEDQSRALFRPFTQADASTTRKYGGTGLGLYISKQLAERLGGSIAVDSAPGRGSRFAVTLPTGMEQDGALVYAWPRELGAEAAPEAATEAPMLRGRVLVAEDDTNIQRLIALFLRGTDVDLTMVENGRQAVEQALAGEYDLLVTDLQMPEMGGLEAAEWLRKAGFRKPIIVLSANAGSGLAERCRAAGCTDYLPKPFEGRQFLGLLGRYLDGAADADEGARLEHDPDYLKARAVFMTMLAGAPEAMAAWAARGDWDEMRRLAHRIKGSAGAFGHAEAGIAAGRIEAQIAEARFDSIAAAVQGFNDEVSRALWSGDSARAAG